jgi:hypothetical protein
MNQSFAYEFFCENFQPKLINSYSNFKQFFSLSIDVQGFTKIDYTIIHLLKILAFVATITAINNYHGTNQKRENRFLTNQKAAVIILAQ